LAEAVLVQLRLIPMVAITVVILYSAQLLLLAVVTVLLRGMGTLYHIVIPEVRVARVVAAHNEMVRLAVLHLHQVKAMQVVRLMLVAVVTQAEAAEEQEQQVQTHQVQLVAEMAEMVCNLQ
jgi:hypothetical protein